MLGSRGIPQEATGALDVGAYASGDLPTHQRGAQEWSYEGGFECRGLFFMLAEDAFYLDAALTVCKLLGNERRGLKKFLNKCLQDYDRLPIDRSFLDKADLIDHIKIVNELKENGTFAKLKKLRNKWLAHHDSEATKRMFRPENSKLPELRKQFGRPDPGDIWDGLFNNEGADKR